MAGLNDVLSSKDISTTAMPNWYSTATQNIGTGVGAVAPTAPGSTALPAVANTFSPTGQFQSGTNVLQSIGAGAVNPWLNSTDPTTGQTTTTPNTSTAMGGLFNAQQQYLDDIMGDIDTSVTAPSIGAGGFGSKMNLAGIAKARGTAANDLFKNQMQSALQNQQTGVSAGAGLGNIGNQLAQSGLNTATYQQNLPYADLTNQAKILQSLKPDETKIDQKQMSPVSQIGALASALGGSGPVSNLLSSLGVSGGISGLGSILGGGKTGSSIFDYGYNPSNPDNYEPINLDGGEFENPGLPDWFWSESYD